MNNRLDFFMERREQNRFYWFRSNEYLPDLYRILSDAEWELMVEFFDETEKKNMIGECNIPLMSELIGFVQGNNLVSIVQCGHYVGWSTLMFGFSLRRMGMKRGLFSIDKNIDATIEALKWLELAHLKDFVFLQLGDSSDYLMPARALNYLDEDPRLIFIDSSHQYAHTIQELNLWYPVLQKGGLMILHDSSIYAQQWDTTQKGGVHLALTDWMAGKEAQIEMINLNGNVSVEEHLIRQDACGAGIIQK